MPTTYPHLQKHFKLIIENGLPQAPVEIIREGHWVMCCPLCGCMHQIQGVDENAPYTPLCETIPVLYKAQQTVWRKLHPEAIHYTTLHLVKAAS